ncbi:MAG: 50S ribosomal protein L22 [Spirochaetes bacterium]|nr:50S ribosomal protein L22 [Spirochaetota bacterium]
MEAKAITKTVRISPYKARLVADVIKGEGYSIAVEKLNALPKKASDIILKTLKSAGANARNVNPDVNERDLFVKKITVDEGFTLKRFRPRARGRAGRIRKRTSHVTIILSDEN